MTRRTPKKPSEGKTGRTRRKPVLPQRVVELLAAEIARGFAGEVYMGAASHRRLMQAVRPHEATLALDLCRHGKILPSGTVRLKVPRNFSAPYPGLDPNKYLIKVDYEPKSGRWTSEADAGWPGFDLLCAHVWRIMGRSEGMATRDLYAMIGAAYVASLAEEGAS